MKYPWVIIILAVVGILSSGYLLKVFYEPENAVCDVNTVFSCTEVAKSKYSTFLGIPNALSGILMYSAVLVLGILALRGVDPHYLLYAFLVIMLFSVPFSLYLTYVEFAVIGALCMFCLLSQLIVLVYAVMAYDWYRSST